MAFLQAVGCFFIFIFFFFATAPLAGVHGAQESAAVAREEGEKKGVVLRLAGT